jgi:hypothetical protein
MNDVLLTKNLITQLVRWIKVKPTNQVQNQEKPSN